MIDRLKKHECTGCQACEQVCPKDAIQLNRDGEGFLYPTLDHSKCIECGLCEDVCPAINRGPKVAPTHVYACHSGDEGVRSESSSGGIFTLLASKILEQGGVVYGAQYDDDYAVKHIGIESIAELNRLRGSKYSQSDVGGCYSEILTHLKDGRKVLFAGTPCQVAGLRLYLETKLKSLNDLRTNITLLDFICHGVPSPMVWSRYLEEAKRVNNIEKITHLTHRDKSSGWRRYSVAITALRHDGSEFKSCELFHKNPYIRGFLNDLYLRPSCYACPAKSFTSGSDITVADYWYVEKHLEDDDRGCSMVIPHTEQGRNIYDSIECIKQEGKVSMIQKIAYTSPRLKRKRKRFFIELSRGDKSLAQIVAKLTAKPLHKRITRSIRKMLKI